MEMSGELQAPAVPVRKRIGQNTGWVPEPVWTSGEKSLAPAKIRTKDRPSLSLITILTELSRLSYKLDQGQPS